MQSKSDINKIFGSRLKAIRKEKRMTQDEFAECLSIGRTLYTKYETGVAMPHCHKLCQIAKILCVSVDFLLGINDNNTECEKTRRCKSSCFFAVLA